MPKVFESVSVGPMLLKNRLISEPLVSNTDVEGYVTQAALELIRERAAGGVSLVIVDPGAIGRDGPPASCFGIYNDRYIPGLTKITDAIHQEGGKACIQLAHSGRCSPPSLTRVWPSAPSEKTPPFAGRVPHGLTAGECEDVIEKFATAALRAKQSGFDAVSFHATHGLLLNQFMSPYYNVGRTDKYADPMAFVSQVIQKSRQLAGPDMALMIRIAGDEFLGDKGINLKMVVEVTAPALVKAGINAIGVTTGYWPRFDAMFPPLYYPRGVFMYMAEAVHKAVRVPVIGVGRINDYRLAQKYIEEDKVDLIGLGRQVLADPTFPKKMFEGKYDEIVQCMACDACLSPSLPKAGLFCAANPTLGHKKEFPLVPAKTREKVLVVGGGVAGMEAARVAALRGHEVVLYEKTDRLGGQVNISAAIPRVYTRELRNYTKFLVYWLGKLKVKVCLCTEATPEIVKNLRPNTIVLATGSRPMIPDIPGVNKALVITKDDALRDESRVGKRVAILGAARGAEIAVSLGKAGKQVTILDKAGPSIIGAAPYMTARRLYHLGRMVRQLSTILTDVQVKEVTDHGVEYVDKEGLQHTLDVDTVILALGRDTNKDLAGKLGNIVVYDLDARMIEIGDCVDPRTQMHAIHDGFYAGYGIGDPAGMEVAALRQVVKDAGYVARLPKPGMGKDVMMPPDFDFAMTLPPLIPGLNTW